MENLIMLMCKLLRAKVAHDLQKHGHVEGNLPLDQLNEQLVLTLSNELTKHGVKGVKFVISNYFGISEQTYYNYLSRARDKKTFRNSV